MVRLRAAYKILCFVGVKLMTSSNRTSWILRSVPEAAKGKSSLFKLGPGQWLLLSRIVMLDSMQDLIRFDWPNLESVEYTVLN